MKMTARAAGVLFLISTVAYLIGSGLMDSVLDRPDFLARLYPDRASVYAGLFLELINAMAVAGIAILLHPILKQHNEAFALGYFGSRILESALLILSAIAPFLLVALSDNSNSADAATAGSPFAAIGDLLVEARSVLFEMAMIVLSLGSLLLCRILYRSRLVPRALSVIGFVGYAALLANSCLAILGQEIGPVLFVPGAIFEIVFPLWLIMKGLHHKEKIIENGGSS
ncbi:DUF4386 domain-containing protein [Cohnella thailandensis]|uniref:DUF4386 domain-containing protein n=1 Tax=Cohnella thailandensis TaxID=557557 RepID=A0A841SLJ4_9BACL|nr:DUF4386 domain-containing protein [Cohnella thailandensis]MBB6633363.1 DUF4386 domain-containing protein [Cohnella thailandensis]MBP1977295.1 hypothetical protein [Cohnella thailandensis]